MLQIESHNNTADGMHTTAAKKMESKLEKMESTTDNDPDALDCKDYLRSFRQGLISNVEQVPGYEKSYVTRTLTPVPFYWATHSPLLDKIRASSFIQGFYYESELTARVIEAFKGDGDNSNDSQEIFLDVGGNIGWFSLVAAAHGASKVYTFEPNPTNLLRICESIILNGFEDIIQVIPKGVSNVDETRMLYQGSESNPGSFTFNRLVSMRLNNRTAVELGEMLLVQLDSFAEKRGWFAKSSNNSPAVKIAFFKLDVEGFEPMIMKGTTKLFNSGIVRQFAMEMKNGKMHSNRQKKDMVKTVFEAGYDLYQTGSYRGPNSVVKKKYDTWESLAEDIITKKDSENLLFRRREDDVKK